MRRGIGAIALTTALLFTQTSNAGDGQILEGLVDIPRLAATAPIDGCAKVSKGLIHSGGFLVFTCEKLLPYHPISKHEASFREYQTILASNGWRKTGQAGNAAKFRKTDNIGCETRLEVTLWTDRSMNEFPVRPASDRDAHRQIVFKAWFRGDACDVHYETAELISD